MTMVRVSLDLRKLFSLSVCLYSSTHDNGKVSLDLRKLFSLSVCLYSSTNALQW